MSGMAHFFMSVGGSKFHERLAHFFIDIYILEIQYRGAVVKVPSGVDMDAIAALLRSLQSL